MTAISVLDAGRVPRRGVAEPRYGAVAPCGKTVVRRDGPASRSSMAAALRAGLAVPGRRGPWSIAEARHGVPARRRMRAIAVAAAVDDVYARRRRAAAAVGAGLLLLLVMLGVALVGRAVEAASAPVEVGVSTVYVKQGQSISAIAAAVAPGMPREAAVERIRTINGLPNTAVHRGQALLVPVYAGVER